MAGTIFREKSVQRVSSPEELNDYIRVTTPGTWLTLAAVGVLLAGFIVWGAAGTLETKMDTAAVANAGTVVCYIPEAEIAAVAPGDAVRVNNEEFTVAQISAQPSAVDGSFPAYALRVGSLAAGEWVYEAILDGSLPDGVYTASVVTDRVSPISFLFN